MARSNDSVRPENIIWIFGCGRSGSTWLAAMTRETLGWPGWGEPLVGQLFGDFYHSKIAMRRADHKGFVLPGKHEQLWKPAVRAFVLESIRTRYPEAPGLVVKEPNGSEGAPVILKALPESRLMFLVRDPRDVMASVLDSISEGGWQARAGGGRKKRDNPTAHLREHTALIVRRLVATKRAHDAHPGPKTIVRYEDLRRDTHSEVRRVLNDIEVSFEEHYLAHVVNERAWENIPEEKKGPGKKRRKADPGSWREDLTEPQARIVEELSAPILEDFYSA